jgi:hypothetical protein
VFISESTIVVIHDAIHATKPFKYCNWSTSWYHLSTQQCLTCADANIPSLVDQQYSASTPALRRGDQPPVRHVASLSDAPPTASSSGSDYVPVRSPSRLVSSSTATTFAAGGQFDDTPAYGAWNTPRTTEIGLAAMNAWNSNQTGVEPVNYTRQQLQGVTPMQYSDRVTSASDARSISTRSISSPTRNADSRAQPPSVCSCPCRSDNTRRRPGNPPTALQFT